MRSATLWLALCLLPLASALVVSTSGRAPQVIGRRPAAAALQGVSMKSQEDKEFEEWMAKKREAAGVNLEEDFGASRRAEGTIYAIGGFIAIAVPVVAGLWAYNEGYLTPQ